jgi:two-component system cell cycle response regulator
MSSARTRVLIVEDDRTQSLILKAQLQDSSRNIIRRPGDNGFEVRCVSTLAEVEAVLDEFDPEVILLDLNLPDSDGLDTLTKVRKAAPAVPTVVLTGQEDEETAIAAISQGAQDFLTKGGTSRELVSRSLRYAIERHGLLNAMSLYDDLTGLCNRRGFTMLAEHQLKLAVRRQQPCLLFYLDMDGLKRINDTYNHEEGSAAIVGMAGALKRTFRSSDIAARIGGDEFVILSIDADASKAEAIVNRLDVALAEFNSHERHHYCLSASIGIAEAPVCCESDLRSLMKQADESMYANKQERRQRTGETALSFVFAPRIKCSHWPPDGLQ